MRFRMEQTKLEIGWRHFYDYELCPFINGENWLISRFRSLISVCLNLLQNLRLMLITTKTYLVKIG